VPKLILIVLIALAIPLAGCRKKPPPPPAAYNIGGVKVDSPKLAATLKTASPDAQGHVTEFEMALRYSMYDKALVALDKLANDQSLTEPQKKVVNEVIEQIKQLINQHGTGR